MQEIKLSFYLKVYNITLDSASMGFMADGSKRRCEESRYMDGCISLSLDHRIVSSHWLRDPPMTLCIGPVSSRMGEAVPETEVFVMQ